MVGVIAATGGHIVLFELCVGSDYMYKLQQLEICLAFHMEYKTQKKQKEFERIFMTESLRGLVVTPAACGGQSLERVIT